ncbi:MAG: hypothetical protein JWQ55_973 [Rhodopila sp.]|nr:hypothetical protein [Rhodopila sp.]
MNESRCIFLSLDGKQLPRQGGDVPIRLKPIEQWNQMGPSFGGSQAELGGVAADGVGKLGAITDQPVTCAGCLAAFKLRTVPNRPIQRSGMRTQTLSV